MTGKRVVLRTGFGVIIALLVIATYTAYRIQDSFSKKTVAIYHRFVQQQTVLTNLRRSLYAGGIAARDYFLNESGNRTSVFSEELKRLELQTKKDFDALRSFRTPEPTMVQLDSKFNDLWLVLRGLQRLDVADSQEYGFVQSQIVPRRDAAAVVLRQLERANERNLAESEEEFASSRRSAATSLVLMLFAGLGLGVFVMRVSLRHSDALEKQAEEQFQEVSRAKNELERLSARLMEIQEEERTKLSRELHDEIVQNLAVLKIEITQAQARVGDRSASSENLARARELAERTVKTVRNIMVLLRPSLLDDLGLAPAMQWLTDDFSQRTGTRCEFYENGLQDDLPDAVKTCVFRVTQEALHNCEKHAHAKRVSVRAGQYENYLLLEVEDDGVGLDKEKEIKHSVVNMHFGVIGMRERAAGLGGTLTIDSKKQEGTKVTLRLPVRLHSKTPESRTEAHV